MKTKPIDKTFWKRLLSFVENVQVNDMPSKEEKQYIINVAKENMDISKKDCKTLTRMNVRILKLCVYANSVGFGMERLEFARQIGSLVIKKEKLKKALLDGIQAF